MKGKLESKTIKNSVIIFCICLLVHAFEVMILRTDETVVAECFVNKVFGILLLFVVLKMLQWHWSEIGFKKEGFIQGIVKGVLICIFFYAIAFAVEFIALYAQGNPGHMEFFVTGFSLTGSVVKQTGIGFVLMCIGFNVINVWMEEGLFRGFYIRYIGKEHSEKCALYVAALLFGIWHLVTPLRSVIDGEMNLPTFLVMSIGYVVLSAMMGIKWGLLYQMTGVVWIGLADHFFNNCVVTNLLHVVTDTGVDEMQILRVLIGELLSFVVIVIYAKKKMKHENIVENAR